MSYEDIEELAEREVKEYNIAKKSDYAHFLNNYIKASAIIDENRFSLIRNSPEMSPVLKTLGLDSIITPDPVFKSTAKELVSEIINKHFTGNKLGEFSLSDEIFGQQKIVVVNDAEGKPSLVRLTPNFIADILGSLLVAVNQNVFSIMVSEINFNVWYSAVLSLVSFGNSAVYIDTGIDNEYFNPCNVELTDICWVQNEKNVIDRVYCRKKYKGYQLKDNFTESEMLDIRRCFECKDGEYMNKNIELLHIVCKNQVPSAERKKYSIIGKDKDYLSLLICKDSNSKDTDFPYKIIRVGGYDKLPYIITRINKRTASSNYGYSLILEVGEAAIANSLMYADITDIARNKGKPPRLEIPGFIEGGNLNLNRRGVNRAKIDHGMQMPINPVSILQTVDGDAIPILQSSIQMNASIQKEVLLRTERDQISRNAGDINNFVTQLLDNTVTMKMSPLSSAIEAELKKPLLEFIANYFILNEFNRLTTESKEELESLKIQLNQQKKMLGESLEMLRKDLNTDKGFSGATELRFKEKLWMALTGNDIDLLNSWEPTDEENAMIVAMKLNYFWDVLFDYDNEILDSVNRFNIKSVKNIDLKLIPLREEVALMQDVNLKIQSLNQLLQISQIDPETAKARIDIDTLYSDMRKIPMMKNAIRDDNSSMAIRQQMAQMRQQQAESMQQQQQPEAVQQG